MKLFIQIRDGQPFEHPIFEDNFREAFPDIDLENLPPAFAEFERIPMPQIGLFEAAELNYGWDGAIVKDVWVVRQMTPAEKAQRTSSMAAEINASVGSHKSFVQEQIDSTSGDVQAAWLAHLNDLNAWVLIDVENPNLPPMPFNSVTDPGTEPHVIG